MGAAPPSKTMKTPQNKLETQRMYESSKRKRAFNPQWKIGHPWLELTDGNDTMICTTCRTAGKIDSSILSKNSFAAGSQSFKLESIKIHEASNKHQLAKQVVKSIVAPEQRPAHKILTTLRQEDIDKLSHLYRTCHALAMKKRPFSDCVVV